MRAGIVDNILAVVRRLAIKSDSSAVWRSGEGILPVDIMNPS